MVQDLWVFALAVVFVSVNGLTQLNYAASMGFAMKPTALAYFVGVFGNLITGSVTPISGQAAMLTVSGFMKNINQRVGALMIAVVLMVPIGIFGVITEINNFAVPLLYLA